jgi:hypothetical protein
MRLEFFLMQRESVNEALTRRCSFFVRHPRFR